MLALAPVEQRGVGGTFANQEFSIATLIALIPSACRSDQGSAEGTFESAMEACGFGENPADVRIDDEGRES